MREVALVEGRFSGRDTSLRGVNTRFAVEHILSFIMYEKQKQKIIKIFF